MQTTNLDTRVLLDSDVLRHDEGYERIWIVDRWHPDRKRMAQIHILVDRLPHRSIAEASVWAQRGWQPVVTFHPDDWWMQVPSYQRYHQGRVITQTDQLAGRLMDELDRVASAL